MAASGGKLTKWIPALPYGWEARYDDGNKAYFFIDHVNKKTQWDDPRFNTPAQQAHQTTPASAASSLGQGGGPARTQGGIALRDLSPHPHQRNQSQDNWSSVHESNLTTEVDAAIVNKLRAEFPKATKELITDMVALCHNSERETREQLNDLGFLSSNAKGRSASQTSPHHNKSSEQTMVKRSPNAHQPAPAATAQAAPKMEMSENDKKRVLNQARNCFPKLDPEVVRIALNESHYDLEEVKVLLTAWEKRPNSEDPARTTSAATSARSGSTSVVSSASSTRSFSPPAGSLEPVGFDDILGSKLKVTGNSQASSNQSGNSASPKRSTGASSAGHSASAKGEPASSSKISCSQHARAKQVTKMSEHLLNTTSDLLNHLATTANCCTSGEDEEEERDEEGKKKLEVEGATGDKNEQMSGKQPVSKTQPAVVTSQPAVQQRSNVESLYRTEAKGPDASLRNGPDSTLLTSDYTQANGPDKTICSGPNRSYRAGPQGAAGPDRALRCGPQSSLLQENRNNLLLATNGLVNHV